MKSENLVCEQRPRLAAIVQNGLLTAGKILLAGVLVFSLASCGRGSKEEQKLKSKITEQCDVISEVISVKITDRDESRSKKKSGKGGLFGSKRDDDRGYRQTYYTRVEFTAKVRLAANLYLREDPYITSVPNDLFKIAERGSEAYDILERLRGAVTPVHRKGDIVTVVGKAKFYEDSSYGIITMTLNDHLIFDLTRRRHRIYYKTVLPVEHLPQHEACHYDTEVDVCINNYLPLESFSHEQLSQRVRCK